MNAHGFDTTPVFACDDELEQLDTLGELGDANAPIGLRLDASGNIVLPTPDQLAQYLPPGYASLGNQAVAAAQSAIGAVQGAAPAIGLIGTIASGATPDPQSIVGALSATAALVNPVAGAVIGAAGEVALGLSDAAQGLFQSLGLISPPPTTYGFNGGFKVGQTTPYSRADPIFQPWTSFAAPYQFNTSGPNAGLPTEFVWQHVLSQANAASSAAAMPMTGLLYAINRYGEVAGDGSGAGYQIGPIGKNAFETFFFEMLKTDFENWWNVLPALPPRDLLMGAVALWNHTHASVAPVMGGVPIPLPPGVSLPPGVALPSIPVQVGGDITYASSDATGSNNPIAWILTGQADMSGFNREAPPITVHMGPLLSTAAPPAPSPSTNGQAGAAAPMASSSSSSSAAPLVAVGAAAAAGTGLWLYLGRPMTMAALKAAWKRLFR